MLASPAAGSPGRRANAANGRFVCVRVNDKVDGGLSAVSRSPHICAASVARPTAPMPRPETTKTKIVRLVFATINVLILCIGVALGSIGLYHRAPGRYFFGRQLGLNVTRSDGNLTVQQAFGNVTDASWNGVMVRAVRVCLCVRGRLCPPTPPPPLQLLPSSVCAGARGLLEALFVPIPAARLAS